MYTNKKIKKSVILLRKVCGMNVFFNITSPKKVSAMVSNLLPKSLWVFVKRANNPSSISVIPHIV